MAVFTIQMFSKTFLTPVEFHAIIPSETPEGVPIHLSKDTKFDTVFLLHGAFGGFGDWIHHSSIVQLATALGVAVILPSVENSFYQDMYIGKKYFTFITEELYPYVHYLFPLSTENNYTIGLSMGGYGAFYLALRRPDLFKAAVSLSGVMDLHDAYVRTIAEPEQNPFPWNAIFKDPDASVKKEANLMYLAKQLVENPESKKNIPALAQWCGTEDILHENNISANKEFKAMGLDIPLYLGEGAHVWSYWDKHIGDAIQWVKNPSVLH